MQTVQQEYEALIADLDAFRARVDRLREQIAAQGKEYPEFEKYFITGSIVKEAEKCAKAIGNVKEMFEKNIGSEMKKLPLMAEYEALSRQRDCLRTTGIHLAALLAKAGAGSVVAISQKLLQGDVWTVIKAYQQRVTGLSASAVDPASFGQAFTLQKKAISDVNPSAVDLESFSQAFIMQKKAANDTAFSSDDVRAGSVIRFGAYPRTAVRTDKSPIEWLVLTREGKKALLLSCYGLDAHRFDASTYQGWVRSGIRAWLNRTFLNSAFTAKEQECIATTKINTPDYHGYSGGPDTQDKIWLLSRDEAETYFRNDEARKAIPTEYAVAKGAYQDSGSDSRFMLNGTGCCWWWLRSPGYYSNYASIVDSDGSFSSDNVLNASASVRPAFWLDLNSVDIY